MKILLILLVLFTTSGMIAETRYVSDTLTIFLRSGPTHQYRIVGNLESGEAVEVIADDTTNNATQVRLSTGREVWVDTEQLITNKPSKLLLKEATAKLKQLENSSNQQLSDMQQKLVEAKKLASLSQELQKQVTQLNYDKELLEQKNNILNDRSRYDLLTAGGVVALVGLFVGLLLPKLLSRRRKDVWR